MFAIQPRCCDSIAARPQNYAFAMPYPEMAFFRAHATTLSAVLAFNTTGVVVEGEDKQVEANFVTANFFSELGATPRLGRLLDPARDAAPDADPVVVLDRRLLAAPFRRGCAVIGRTIRLNRQAGDYRGCGPARFQRPPLERFASVPAHHPTTLFYTRQPTADGFHHQQRADVGPAAAGVAPKAAEEELSRWRRNCASSIPTTSLKKKTFPAIRGLRRKHDDRRPQRDGIGKAERVVSGDGPGRHSGLLILAVACGNLGSLLMARGVAREREIAIRVAVGAGKGRLIRQLFTESLLLALLGAAAGLALGYAVLRGLMTATGSPAWLDASPDWRVAVFAFGVGCVSAILFGLMPAFQAARQRHRATIARQVLVGAQVAASCVLLIVAGLLGRALKHVMSSNPGFDYQQVIAIDPRLGLHGYSPARARAYLDTLQNRLRALPGVDSVSLAQSPPLGRRSEIAGIDLDGRHMRVQINRVDPQFFQTMKIPLLRGRNLVRGEAHAIVVGESLARAAWPGQDPLGKKFTMDEPYTVVGIAGTARVVKLEDSDSVEVYFPIAPADLPGTSVLVRTAAAPEGLMRVVASTAKAVDPNTFPEVQLMKSGFRQKLRGAESSALAVSALGCVADLLACLGIVGVVAYAVSQRTREIGIRMALGARPAHILSVVLRQFSRPLAAGLLLGVAAAAALSGLLRGELYGISNLDPMAYVGAVGLFALTVAVAALWPARRALRVDPMRALRHE